MKIGRSPPSSDAAMPASAAWSASSIRPSRTRALILCKCAPIQSGRSRSAASSSASASCSRARPSRASTLASSSDRAVCLPGETGAPQSQRGSRVEIGQRLLEPLAPAVKPSAEVVGLAPGRGPLDRAVEVGQRLVEPLLLLQGLGPPQVRVGPPRRRVHGTGEVGTPQIR